MTGKERLQAVLKKQPTDRMPWTTLVDNNTLDRLPPELHGTLFRQFHRGPAARAGGLGLGLSIVRGFALAHGGDVVATILVVQPRVGACVRPMWRR